MNLKYLIPRIIRHFLPEKIVRYLLLHNLIIQAGLETTDPAAAVERYTDILSQRGLVLQGKRVMVFGYGGRFDIGLGLLRAGAGHVVLCDRYAPPDEEHNRRAFAAEEKYFILETDGLRPRREWMTLLPDDIRDDTVSGALEPFDYVISNSVYEHLDDVEGITRALAHLTKPGGLHIHYVDLRDHFFKYPFEMLRFSERTWKTWLNPSSNHNRYRIWNYHSVFEANFRRVEIEVLAREEDEFQKILPHVRPEFVSGDMAQDSVSLIRVIASN